MAEDQTHSVASEDAYEPRELNTGVPHIARIYDYWLGGKDNYAADRQVAEQMSQVNPHVAEGVRANRAFLARSVRRSPSRWPLKRGSSTPTTTGSCSRTLARC